MQNVRFLTFDILNQAIIIFAHGVHVYTQNHQVTLQVYLVAADTWLAGGLDKEFCGLFCKHAIALVCIPVKAI